MKKVLTSIGIGMLIVLIMLAVIFCVLWMAKYFSVWITLAILLLVLVIWFSVVWYNSH